MSEHTTLEAKKEKTKIISPLTNIIEKEKEVILEAEMVGLTREDIDLELNGNDLTILGKQRGTGVPKDYSTLYRERGPIEYRRSFTLGSMVKKESINAKYEDGVLKLTLPKVEETVPKKLQIN